jgi:ribosomal protein S7
MRTFQKEVYNLCEKNISPTEVTTSYMVAGILMKTAIEIYVSTLDEEAVMKVVDAIKDTVPLVAEKMQRELGEVTYH